MKAGCTCWLGTVLYHWENNFMNPGIGEDGSENVLGIVLVNFLLLWQNTWQKANTDWKEEIWFWLQLGEIAHCGVGRWRRECEAAGCIAFAIGSRMRWMPILSLLFLFFASHDSTGWCLPHSGWAFPPQLSLLVHNLRDTKKVCLLGESKFKHVDKELVETYREEYNLRKRR